MMDMAIEAFHLQKAGNAPEEYEDAFWPRFAHRQLLTEKRLAVADGATECSFADLWAKLLVRAYGRNRLTSASLQQQVSELQGRWLRWVSRKPLPWYAEEKARQGAFAAFLGLTLRESDSGDAQVGEWEAIAIGDCCLFQVRDSELLVCFPMERSNQFGSRPVLIPSVPGRPQWESDLHPAKGYWHVGDTFFLMSDALAHWFLRQWERRADPLQFVLEVHDSQEFERFINCQRADLDGEGVPLLRNDDVTLITCTILEHQDVCHGVADTTGL